jgi:signal peptidase I
VGNAHQLTSEAADRRTWKRTVLYGLGMVSMLIISMAGSLSLWIALPWAFLDWTPTLVTTGSMQPLITPGDVVMVRPVDAADLAPNTVVLFDRAGDDDDRVLHRIVEQNADGTFITRGDANAVDDSDFLHAEDVEGAAVLSVPWIGRPSLWLSEGRTLWVTATGATLIFVLGMAPRAFDPAYDPWAAGKRVKPVELLLGRLGGDPGERRSSSGSRLLPDGLQSVVLDRLAAQSAAAQLRTAHLVEGLS